MTDGRVGTDSDVLVVGAGPTGLALAAQLAAHGTRARIIDRSRDRARESRALAVQPRTLEVLAPLGVTAELVRRGNPNVALAVHARDRVVSMPMFDLGLADTAYPYLLFLSQAETEAVLIDHLRGKGLSVERGTELVGIQARPDGVTCRLLHNDGREETADATYLVGSDGANSAVRRLAGIEFAGGSYPQTFVLADLEADGIEPGAAHVFLSGHGMLFFFPLVRPASWRLLVMRPRDDPTPADAPVSLAQVQALVDVYTDGAVGLRAPVWMTNFRIHHRAASRYRTGRVLLAGDAAHIHSPAGAQGMNTGIQDATNLAWKIAHTLRGADPALIDTYGTERVPIGRAVLRMSDRAFAIATAGNPIARFARARIAPALLPLAVKAGRPRARLFRVVSQLGIAYRHSPLSTDDAAAPRHAPRAGDRLPDTPVTLDGVPTTLHTVLSTPGWHLLLHDAAERCTDDVVTLGSRYRPALTVHRIDAPPTRSRGTTGASAAVHLIRPDGHIGYRAGRVNLPRIAAYLDRWLPPPGPHRPDRDGP
jgi:2-polyprenyl-6-methoxyphenol hydroxylase-like FAD-dependent oxidoreductase